MSYGRVAQITLGSLGIGHSIGLAALSSGAVRLRMYGRSGLGVERVARVVVFSAVTVTLGFTTLIATGLIFNHALVVSVMEIDRSYTTALAAGLLCVPFLYLVLCFLRREPLTVGRRFSLPLPHPAIAGAQIALGCSNLLLKAAVLTACINLFVAARTMPRSRRFMWRAMPPRSSAMSRAAGACWSSLFCIICPAPMPRRVYLCSG